MQFGISKEFDEAGLLSFVAIVWNNDTIKVLTIKDGQISEIELNDKISQRILPERIKYLLELTDRELLEYKNY